MASLNFPANPSNGDVFENFTYNSDVGAWRRIGGSGAASITVSETAPTQGLSAGALWLDSTSGNTYIYYEDADNAQWVQTAGPDITATRGSDFTIQTTAPANPVDGDIWYDPTEGFTYIYYEDVDSSQWVQFGLNRNGAPGINGTDGADGADGIGIPVGGTEGQALVKSSATDYAVEWGSVAGGGGLLTLDSDTINVDFNDSNSLYTRAVAGDVTFTGSDYTAGATKKIYLQGDTVQRTLTFPAGWTFLNDKPTAIGADVNNILDINSFGTSESTTVGIWLGQSVFSSVSMTGGTESQIIVSGVTYKVHTFTSTESYTVSDLGQLGEVEYLIVAGGGSGGNRIGGGGGAGGLVTGSASVGLGTFTAEVGAGGAAKTTGGNGNNGGNSTFLGITAIGGGGGGGTDGLVGSNGGSGGGGGRYGPANGGQGTVNQGNDGGVSSTAGTNPDRSGGGGGAGSVGASGPTSGNGGDGLSSSISGTLVTYAGGGGGSAYGGAARGVGGQGGGGQGADGDSVGTSGAANTGGGGGGGGYPNNLTGLAGGSGIIIVRYPITDPN